MSTTVNDIITQSLRALGVIASNEVPSADDSFDALSALNRLLDQWKMERLNIYTITRTTWSIVSGTQDYTLGTGGTINVMRPVFLDHVNYQDTSLSPTQEYLLQPLTDDAWSNVPQKALTSTRPTCWYYNPTYTTGFGTISVWPVPTSTTLQGVLYAPAAVDEFTAVTSVVSLPPGYRRMLVSNLALELAPEYQREVHPGLVAASQDSKSAVKRANKRLMDLSVDAAALIQGRDRSFFYSINTGP